MLPDTVESLHRMLAEAGIEVLLAGGWAVNEHGYGRHTKDVDWVACTKDEPAVRELMISLKFQADSESKLATRYRPLTLGLPIVDFLWVIPQTYEKLQSGRIYTGRHGSIPLLRLDHLIAMKIHALKSHEEREGRDLLDIRHLLKANPGVISDQDLRTLSSKYGPPEAYQLITDS